MDLIGMILAHPLTSASIGIFVFGLLAAGTSGEENQVILRVVFVIGAVVCALVILWHGGAWLIAKFIETVHSYK